MVIKTSKVFVADNVFDEFDLKKIKDFISNSKIEDWTFENTQEEYVKYRLHNTPTWLYNYARSKLFSTNNSIKMKEIDDNAFHTIKFTTNDFFFVTSHITNKPCGWHKNDMTGFPGVINTLNFVFHIDLGAKFSGGNFKLSYDNIPEVEEGWYPLSEPTVHETIEYKDNRLVIFPTHLWHMVDTIKTPDNASNPLDGRITMNGHIGFKV